MHTHSLHSRATRRRGEAKALHPLPEGEGGVRGQSPMRTFPAGDRGRGLNILDCLSPKGEFLKCTEDDRECRIRMFAGCPSSMLKSKYQYRDAGFFGAFYRKLDLHNQSSMSRQSSVMKNAAFPWLCLKAWVRSLWTDRQIFRRSAVKGTRRYPRYCRG
jgi:hypothetical protein